MQNLAWFMVFFFCTLWVWLYNRNWNMESVKFEVKNATMLCKSFSGKIPLDYFASCGRAQADGTWCLWGQWKPGTEVGPVFRSPPILSWESWQSLTGWRNDHLFCFHNVLLICGSWNPMLCRHCIAFISQRGIPNLRNSLTLPSSHKWQVGTLFRTQPTASTSKSCALPIDPQTSLCK